ncbi:MAG: flavodoxin [Saprospiraceae bacterium]|nr:flavodoxin [Saprospiraceae bacterium]
MIRALIVYASLTGNTEEIAHLTAEALNDCGVSVIVKECTDARAIEFTDVDLCVVATYTYGSDGELPDEIYDFYEDLAEVDLCGKVFGCLGSGEEFYGNFCKSADDFDLQFMKTNAIRGADVVKIEENAKDEDKQHIRDFAENLVSTFQKVFTQHISVT